MENAVSMAEHVGLTGGTARLRPSRWPVEKVVLIAFLIAALTIATTATLVLKTLNQSRESSRWVAHTHSVLETIERVYSSLNDATGQIREYVITENRELPAAKEASIVRLTGSVEDLQQLTVDNPVQQKRVAELRVLLNRRIAVLNSLQATRDAQGFQAARDALVEGSAVVAMAHVRAKLNDMAAMEQALLATRSELDQRNNDRLTALSIGLISVVAFTVLFAFRRVRRELVASRNLSAALDESRHFFQAVFENLPNMAFIKSARDFRYIAFNAAAERLMETSRAEVLGKTDFDIMPAELAGALEQKEREIVRTGKAVDFSREHIRDRNGEDRIMHTRKTIIANADGTPMYLIGISEDITDRVRTEEQIRALNEDLNTKAAALEAANKDLESFCYSVSHDLRAPLRAVNGYALMLQEDHAPQLNDEAKRFIKTIRDGANRMGRLIDDLLAFSRLGRAPMKLETLDANAMATRALDEVLEINEGPAPQLAMHELPKAQGDPALVYQVWTNLIGNAVKYSSKVAAPRIEIGGLLNGAEVVYYVKDNGAGFDMRYVNKLFGVFQRLHGHDEFPGTGVGLAIVHRVITRHGGRVWAESEPGKGATFSFTLARGDAA